MDLFAGAGLFSHAFACEGYGIVDAIERELPAARTYAQNVGAHVRVADIRNVRPIPKRCDAIIAGPPCQGFSTLGKKDRNDPRNVLSIEVARWTKQLQPRVVVIENVAAFVTSPVWQQLQQLFHRMGYIVSAHVLDALDFGSAQRRQRSFTIATLRGSPMIRKVLRNTPRTVRDAWQGLAASPSGLNSHYAPQPTPLALARMRVIPAGGDKRDVMRRAKRLVPPSWWNVSGDVTDVWGRMEWNQPSNTIRTVFINPSKGRYIHPDQDRTITLREGARLQSIPDDWEFYGVPYQVSRQIGNSVPMSLGRAVARAVYSLL